VSPAEDLSQGNMTYKEWLRELCLFTAGKNEGSGETSLLPTTTRKEDTENMESGSSHRCTVIRDNRCKLKHFTLRLG